MKLLVQVYFLLLFICYCCVYCEVVVFQPTQALQVRVIYKPEQCPMQTRNGDILWIHYNGSLADGTRFDSRLSNLLLDYI